MVRKLFSTIAIVFTLIACMVPTVSAQYRSGGDTQLEKHPFEVQFGWTRAAGLTLTPPLQAPITAKSEHLFSGTLCYRPFSVVTTSLGVLHGPMRSDVLSPDTPRITGTEFQLKPGISVATDWMQPIRERANVIKIRFRGGFEYDLFGRDLRLETCDINGRVTTRDLVTLQEHVCFIGMDVGFHNPISRSLGIVYLTFRLDQLLPVWGNVPDGTALDLTRSRFAFGLGISRGLGISH